MDGLPLEEKHVVGARFGFKGSRAMTESVASLLQGIRVVTLAPNLPGPAAAAHLVQLGAEVIKVEPPTGDPMARFNPVWYAELHQGQSHHTLDLKQEAQRERLHALLSEADVLITSSRPAALRRLQLDWPTLQARHPHLCQVAIIGYPAPDEDRPGHDLTYLAEAGLLEPDRMPRTLAADLIGAERTVSTALALLLSRQRTGKGAYASVALFDGAQALAAPLRHGVTRPGGLLAGRLPEYAIYPARSGVVAVGCLEPHFSARLAAELGLQRLTHASLGQALRERDALDWERWAAERDLPIVALRELAS